MSKSIGGAREVVNNRRKSVRLGQGRLLKTGATVLGSGRLTTVDTGLEEPQRLLTTGPTILKGAMKATNSRSWKGPESLLTAGATAIAG